MKSLDYFNIICVDIIINKAIIQVNALKSHTFKINVVVVVCHDQVRC